MKNRRDVMLCAALILGVMSACQRISQHNFTHFSIQSPFLPDSYGIGGWTLNDYDGDGDLDVTAQRQGNGEVYWFDYAEDHVWNQYVIGKQITDQLGAASHDMNGDGFPDLILGGTWLENPGDLTENPDQLWRKHPYDGGMSGENHDIVVADIDNDGNRDVICYNQSYGGGTLRWYDISNPLQWQFTTIDSQISRREVPEYNRGIHAGFAPNGIGDLNGDSFADIIMPTGWYENQGDQIQPWKLHRWIGYGLDLGVKKTPYGTSFRSWITDIDGDGDGDVFITDCDVAMSKAYWLENVDYAKFFTLHELPFETEKSGSFHSLAVIDIDLDGDLDVFSGEQEDPDRVIIHDDTTYMKPPGLKERGFFWENTGSHQNPQFMLRVIQRDNPGWHDAQFGDVDGDGDLDIVSKIWNADEAVWHLDYWRNEIIN